MSCIKSIQEAALITFIGAFAVYETVFPPWLDIAKDLFHTTQGRLLH